MKKCSYWIFIFGIIIGIILGLLTQKYYFHLKQKTGFFLNKAKLILSEKQNYISRKDTDINKCNDGYILSNFEGRGDLIKWGGADVVTSIVTEHSSEGAYCMKVIFPQIDFPGIGAWRTLEADWSKFSMLKFDVYNPCEKSIKFGVLIKDEFGNTYADRFDKEFDLNPGVNNLELTIKNLKTNNNQRMLRLDKIKQIVFFLCKPRTQYTLYFDNIRLIANATITDYNQRISAVINAEKKLEEIKPMIFGSNFGYSTTDSVKVREFAKDFGIAALRFPSGTVGYHWKTSTFDYATKNPYLYVFNNYDQVTQFCKEINAQLVIQLNLESGTPQEATEWVDYTNNKHGFYVKYWDLDNEPYGDWSKAYRTAEAYAKNLIDYSKAMKTVDPSIKVGASWAGEYFGTWDNIVMRNAGEYADFISFHWYPNHTSKRLKVGSQEHPDPLDIMANAFQVPNIIRRMKQIMQRECPAQADKMEIGFLEWDGAWDAPWYNPEPYEQGIVQWSLANALFYAETYAQFIKNGVSLAAQHDFEETPFGLIRGHLTDNTPDNVQWDGETIRPKAYVIKMFTRHFGNVMVESKLVGSPTYFKSHDWYAYSYAGEVPYLSCYASKDKEEKKLFIMLINRHPNENLNIQIKISGFVFNNKCNIWKLTGQELISQNDGNPGQVDIFYETLDLLEPEFTYECPAHSVVSIELDKR